MQNTDNEKRIKSVRSILRSVAVSLVVSVTVGLIAVAIAHRLFPSPYYGRFIIFTVLIIIVMLIANMLIIIMEKRYCLREVKKYEVMAGTDSLTGLNNFMKFQEFIDELEQGVMIYEDIILIMFDVNKLKLINDRFGHTAGSEVIAGVAKCISNVFSDFGTCYRIGGDEFCVLIPDPKSAPEEWFVKLDEEIERYNYGKKYQISVAYGYSHILDENGEYKSIRDWKYETDVRMYEKKAQQCAESKRL